MARTRVVDFFREVVPFKIEKIHSRIFDNFNIPSDPLIEDILKEMGYKCWILYHQNRSVSYFETTSEAIKVFFVLGEELAPFLIFYEAGNLTEQTRLIISPVDKERMRKAWRDHVKKGYIQLQFEEDSDV
jgi:hypothetical protein